MHHAWIAKWRLVALATLLALALVPALWMALARALRRRRLRVRGERARQGERDAPALLERQGFAVIDRQVSARLTLLIDGAPVEVGVRADLIVSRGGRRFVAEVKTGEHATRPTHIATRRQLLEYRHAFAVDGVILVDADQGSLCEVEFPMLPSLERAWSPLRGVVWLTAGALGGAAGAWWWLR